MTTLNLFPSPILIEEHLYFLSDLSKFVDDLIPVIKQRDQKEIEKRNLDLGDIGDRNWVYHSDYYLYEEPTLKEFHNFIGKKSRTFLEEIGYDISKHSLVYNQSWVQEFAKNGGGNHHFHTHSNTHVSGFYFLKASSKTSYPVFIDPRSSHVMGKLPEKDKNSLSAGSEYINLKVKPGTLVMFPSYLSHSFMPDYGIEPFQLIHFTLSAIENRYL